MARQWNPFRDFLELQNRLLKTFEQTALWPYEELTKAYEQTTTGAPGGPERVAWRPSVESYRHGGDLIFRAELPGVDPNEVQVSVQDGTLRIAGQRRRPETVVREDVYMEEMAYGKFERRLDLPGGSKTEEVRANYDNGILEVTVPQAGATAEKGQRVSISIK